MCSKRRQGCIIFDLPSVFPFEYAECLQLPQIPVTDTLKFNKEVEEHT